MLGVGREGITVAAGQLQKARLIDYSRGHIVAVECSQLEARGRGRYRVFKREYERLLPDTRRRKSLPRVSIRGSSGSWIGEAS